MFMNTSALEAQMAAFSLLTGVAVTTIEMDRNAHRQLYNHMIWQFYSLLSCLQVTKELSYLLNECM